MTPGEPSAPKPTVAARAVNRAVPKKATKSTKSTTAREPRLSASKAGAAKRGISPAAMSSTADDILDRLAKLGASPTQTESVDDSMPLPAIVEADPTFPPLSVPAARDLPPEEAGPEPDPNDRMQGADLTGGSERPTALGGATAPVSWPSWPSGPSVSEMSNPAAVVAPMAPAPAPGAAIGDTTTVSADLPTALVGPPVADPDQASPTLASTLAIEALAPSPDRTQLVPAVVPTVLPGTPTAPDTSPEAPAEITPSPGIDETSGVVLPKRPLRPPMVFRRAKPRVRRVTRVVRHVDTWSVFKVALVFNVILYLVCLTSGVLLWNVAHATGTVDNIEKFFEQFGWESFEFKGGEIYHNAWIGGLFVAVGLTGFAVLLATLFNLITDLVGGIRVSVLEEEVIGTPRPSSTVRAGTPAGAADGADGASDGSPRLG